jgi:glycosyltransferase involved in cell wall biosynthesis
MKVLIYPHVLEIGGAQLNAIEIAGALRDLGHEILIFGRPGALNARIDALGLEFVEAPDPRRRPSPSVVRALIELIDARGLDIIHGHEWPPALECLLAARRRRGVRAVATVASMAVAPFIPRTMPLLVGTEQIEAVEREAGRTRLGVLEPPVDVVANHPDIRLPRQKFRNRWGLDPSRHTIVCVSRLAHELKLEGILTAIDAVGDVARVVGTQLVIVGDGPAGDLVRRRADEVNRRVGPGTVILTGETLDPRPAYAVADVALGMGASALRAMAFAKPLIVQGENGFWRTLTPDSLDGFLWTGWYGYGDNPRSGVETLRGLLFDLLSDADKRDVLGNFGRSVAVDRYALTRIAAIQADFYEATRQSKRSIGRDIGADLTAGLQFGRYHVARRAKRVVGRRSTDDFNARPVARTAQAGRSAGANASDASGAHLSTDAGI